MTRTTSSISNLPTRGVVRTMSEFSKEKLWKEAVKEQCMIRFRSSPSIRITRDPEKKIRTAAVLLPMCLNEAGQVSLLYTIRSSNLRRHVGEVAFPGGVKDDTDKDVIECALRETEEEIGIPRERVTVWGVGNPILPYSNFLIHPVVGVIEDFQSLLPLKLSEDEVEDYFLVPLEHLTDPTNQAYTQTRTGFTVLSYMNAKAKVWGITGIITHQFLGALLPPEVYNFDIPITKKLKL